MTRPLRSKRARISPARPRRSASGLMRTSERSVLLDTLILQDVTPTTAGSAYRYPERVERLRRDYRTSARMASRNNLTVTSGRSTLANQTGRPIAPARKLVAAVMGTIAVFVVALRLGLTRGGGGGLGR